MTASVIPFQVPEHMRALAENGVSQARASYSKLRDVAENNNGAIEAMLAGASRGASDYVAKVLEISAANANAGFDLVQQLAGARSGTEAMQIWTDHARSQTQTFATQARELAELTQRITGEVLMHMTRPATAIR